MILYFVCFALTLAIEWGVLLIWVFLRGPSYRTFDLCLLLGGMNCITHPLAWWLLACGNPSFFFAYFGIEIAVVFVEACVLHRLGGLPGRSAFLLSLACNLASLLVGIPLLWFLSFI